MSQSNELREMLMGMAFAALVAAPCAGVARTNAESTIRAGAESFIGDKAPALQPIFRALYVEGEHNAVLNFDYLGLAALETGDYTTAEKAFDAAIVRIEAIYADNPSARKAKSLFAEEKSKDFKGEPYERAMTYYYRGLLYARTGDFQNARASFLSAERQTTLSEREVYDSTFGLMDYLAAWSSYCDGDEARGSELHDRAQQAQPEVFGALPASVSYVGLIDAGVGPVKFGSGQYKERLSFRTAGDSPSISAVTAAPLTLSSPVIAGDLNWQATTRGGRPVDAILNGKAVWRSNTEATSNALLTGGLLTAQNGAFSGNTNLQAAGDVAMLAGLMGGLFAKAMTPAADTRSWAGLPAAIVLSTGNSIPEGLTHLSLEFSAPDAAHQASLNAISGKCALSWARTESALEVAAAQTRSPAEAEVRHEIANQQFRDFLRITFAAAPGAKPTLITDVPAT